MLDRRNLVYRVRRALTHMMLWYDEREEKERQAKTDSAVKRAIQMRRKLEAYRQVHYPR